MMSTRRGNGVILRDGPVRDWSQFNDPSPSPKLLYSQSYVAVRGLLATVASMDLFLLSSKLKSVWAAMTSPRQTRSPERSRSKGSSCKRFLAHLLLFFLVGIFIGFMPFFAVDVSKKIVSENERLPFHDGVIEGGLMDTKVKESETVVVEKEIELIDETEVGESPPVPAMLDDEVDFVRSSRALPAVDGELDIPVKKLLIIVTITSVRPQQAYYLNRLAHVLKAVQSPLLWLVVEWPEQSYQTAEILRSSGIMYRHLICKKNTTSTRKIAVCQRNNAIYHIKKHRLDGIMHFADEERSYTGEVFEEMQKIRRFGSWPVAIHVGTKYRTVLEGPICKGNRVTGWHTETVQKKGQARRFPIGFSAFAFNSTMLWDPQRWNRPPMDSVVVHTGGRGGLQESRFIEKLVKNDRQVEGLPENCNRVMVWNFNLEPPLLNYPTGWSLYKNLEANMPVT